jgi:hypothetical protein
MLKNAPSFVLARSTPQRTARVRLGISLAAAALDGFLNILRLSLPFRPPIRDAALGIVRETFFNACWSEE